MNSHAVGSFRSRSAPLPRSLPQVPALQANVTPLLNIKKDLLDVPKLASTVGTLQTSVTSLQPLVGIKDKLLQVTRAFGAAPFWRRGQTQIS